MYNNSVIVQQHSREKREKSITDVREGAFSDLISVDLRREHLHIEPVFVVTFEFVAQFDNILEVMRNREKSTTDV